jgi:hypothetical protein
MPTGKPIPPPLKRIARLVRLMDSEFKIPGTTITFGLDPVIGLLPVLGDLIDYGISAYLIIAMLQNGASSKSVAKMILNITFDALLGMIPFAGRFVDIFYKANRRNLVLAIEHFEEGKHAGRARDVIIPILAILAILFILLSVLAYFAVKWLWLFLHSL